MEYPHVFSFLPYFLRLSNFHRVAKLYIMLTHAQIKAFMRFPFHVCYGYRAIDSLGMNYS